MVADNLEFAGWMMVVWGHRVLELYVESPGDMLIALISRIPLWGTT